MESVNILNLSVINILNLSLISIKNNNHSLNMMFLSEKYYTFYKLCF